jgi:16S rRNA (cytidine1402-2'-O)-methyltransferase
MSRLYIVPTPIGNLQDITLRALKVLETVDLILAEDTRQTSKLLQHYHIKTPKKAFHQHNEYKVADSIVNELTQSEKTFALVSDAGTPGISDPAYLLINRCIENGITVECLPGPTALIPALIESGLPSDSFCFEGFLPHQKGRNKKLNSLKDETRTMIFYESPYRVIKTLKQFCEVFGSDRRASVSRELTKIHAETQVSNLGELLLKFEKKPPKGEFVIIVNGKS